MAGPSQGWLDAAGPLVLAPEELDRRAAEQQRLASFPGTHSPALPPPDAGMSVAPGPPPEPMMTPDMFGPPEPPPPPAAPAARQPVAFERGEPGAQPVNYAAMSQEAPQGGPMPSDVQFRPVVSRGAPAREAATVGPQQAGHLMGQFDPLDQAAADSGQRSLTQAQSDAAMWAGQVSQAEQRQAAAEHAQAKRAQELEVRRAQFDQTVQSLGKQQLDTGRYWGSQSTGEKIGWGIAVLLGGLGGGGGVGLRALMSNIDEDVNVQREMYKRQLDTLEGQKTAFGMAMDQFQSEDHAMAVARAAALDVTAAKVQQSASQWKGVDAQNEAQMLLAKIQAEREKTLASFLKFQPAQGGGVRYQMAVRGDVLPGTMSEKEAQRAMIEHGIKPAEKRDEATYGAGLDVIKDQAKISATAQAKAQTDKAENMVRLPDGSTVAAPSPGEANELRQLSTAMERTARLVEEAKKIRSGVAFRAPLTEDRGRLKQIQAELVTQFGVQNKLGALSEADMELAMSGTAELFDVGSSVESRLDRLNSTAVKSLQERVKTIPTTDARQGGAMPASFEAD